MKLYRNKIEITSLQGLTIDAESLWRREGQLMILEDDDQYITVAFDADIFEEE